MGEVYGYTEDFIARAMEEMSNRKFKFHEIMLNISAEDPHEVFGIIQEMKKYGAVKSTQPFWERFGKKKNQGPYYLVNPQKLALYRKKYAPPPPYRNLSPSREGTNRRHSSVPIDSLLPSRPTAPPQENTQNMARESSELEAIRNQANQLAGSLDWPIAKFLAFSKEAENESIAYAASQRTSGTEGTQRTQKSPDTTDGKYLSPLSAQPLRGRAH
ncbi:hypothetical protein [Streptomyces sp. NPDC048489]|uniref:hypothetical protein n=1 Tax=Streptomyces sp. NPDC048489 TaxID=3154504 RepID=UPI003431C367